MVIIDEGDLLHYGIIRRSGRYPWGSGGIDRNTRNKIFLDYVDDMKKQGLTESQICEGLTSDPKHPFTTTQLRAEKKIAKAQQRQAQIAMAQRLKDKNYSNVAIGERMGVPESTVRNLLKPGAQDKSSLLEATAESLKIEVDAKTYLDVGKGTESQIGVSRTNLDTAVEMLRIEGYELHQVRIPQVSSPGQYTNIKVLCPPGVTQRDVFLNQNKIQTFNRHTEDRGRTWYGIHPPIQVDSNRVEIKYGKDGGGKEDGIIYVRPDVDDLSLGGKTYAQVRVMVGDGHYLKGVAVVKDDLPDGVDLLFNTSKEDTGNKFDAMKPAEKDAANPFGSLIRNQIVADKNLPTEHVTSAMNIVYEEGDWDDWSRSLSSQMLSKQSRTLAKTQLDMTYEGRENQYKEINRLTNSTVRKRLLEDFADSTDSAAVHLKAAALPRQGVRVILPMSSLNPNHVYAPGYNNGEEVILVRHPHGGTFELPRLTVNNRHQASKKLIGDSPDAIAIHHSVAQHLSGADFDGDTVLVIPNPKDQRRITVTNPLDELKDFDPRTSYPAYPGMEPMRNTQSEMGKISNLITDMTIKNAPHSEIAQAIKHSMVVIDAEKHNLNYKLSYNDNGIKKLKQKYQAQPNTRGQGGAATLISRAGAKERIPERKERRASQGGPVDPVTGRRVYEPTSRTYRNKEGQIVSREVRVKRLALEDDAFILSSGTPMEAMYARHSNKLKTLANQARLDGLNTPASKWSTQAKKTYKAEVDSLDAKLRIAEQNAPLERQANIIAASWVKAKKAENPDMDDDTKKKINFQALTEARARTGADKIRVKITPEEWDAIQAGAISNAKLNRILDQADMDRVRELATPTTARLMSTSKISRASDMLADGYTRAEVAEHLGVSVSTLDKAIAAA